MGDGLVAVDLAMEGLVRRTLSKPPTKEKSRILF
jgi:hypothetical protein